MKAKRYLVPSVLVLSLALAGCSKSAKAPSSEAQSSASQTSANPAAPDNSSTNQSSATATSSSTNASTQVGNNTGDQTAAKSAAPAPLIIPAGTSITVRLQQGLSSGSAVPGERFDAVVDKAVVLDDRTVIPVGTSVTGHVVIARRSGRLRHPGELGLTLDSVVIDNQEVRLTTSHIVARGASHKKRNFGWIGGGTGGGAIIGALAAGGKGALIGSGIGAVAGTTTAFVTGKKNVGFSAERRLTFRLNRDISVTA
jgi:hypothetical protein